MYIQGGVGSEPQGWNLSLAAGVRAFGPESEPQGLNLSQEAGI